MKYFNFLPILLVSLGITWAVIPGPDTLRIDENTYFPSGYDPANMKYLSRKYQLRHTSINYLEAMIDLEWQIFSNVTLIYKNHLESNQLPKNHFSRSVEEYLEDFRTTSLVLVERKRRDGGGANGIKILSTNIITPFLAIRRFRNYIRPWKSMAKESKRNRTSFEDSVARYINSVYKLRDGPFAVEFQISTLAILVPHFMYDMKAEDIAKGHIRGKKLGVTLKACHCLEIGVHGVAMALFPLGIEWLEVTVDKIRAGDGTSELSFAMNWLARANKMHDSQWKPMDSLSLDAIYFSKPLENFTEGEERLWRKQITCKYLDQMESLLDSVDQMPWHLHWSVCKGKIEQSEMEKSKLFCWYERKVHPVWTIGPLKAEFISRFPHGEIVQFYDLLSDPDLMRGYQADPERINPHYPLFNGLPHSKTRSIALTTIVNQTVVKRVESLIEAVTGLRCGDFHPGLDAISYVPGGHSFVHEDWLSYEDRESEFLHFIATFMIYIEQPEEGGETSYPRSLVKTNPLKGSGVYSFNLLRSGRKDYIAPHGACPVIFGGKLLISKDIMYEDQTHLKCGLQEKWRHEILVNGKSKYSSDSKWLCQNLA